MEDVKRTEFSENLHRCEEIRILIDSYKKTSESVAL